VILVKNKKVIKKLKLKPSMKNSMLDFGNDFLNFGILKDSDWSLNLKIIQSLF
jgi:hypothetical protein